MKGFLKVNIKMLIIFFLFIISGKLFAFEAEELKKYISRDSEGIWFVESNRFDKAAAAMGYSVAEDRLWQLELHRRTGKGLLSEIFGADQLEVDVTMRTMGYSHEELEQAYTRMNRKSRKFIAAYVEGINVRIDEVIQNREFLPFEYSIMGQVLGIDFLPVKWDVTDVLAWGVVLLRSFDSEAIATGQLENGNLIQKLIQKFPAEYEAMFNDLRWKNDPLAYTMIDEGEEFGKKRNRNHPRLDKKLEKSSKWLNSRFREIQKKLKKINARPGMGSYAIVVSGDRSATGNPILYSGPQMGFNTPSIVIEGSIKAPGYNVSGMSVPGVPGILIGRSPKHAWSMQVGHANTVDYYIENPSGVFLHREEIIPIAGSPDMTLPIYRTKHGPVVFPMPYDESNHEEVIISWKYSHWQIELELVETVIGLGTMSNLKEFYSTANDVPVSMHICFADNKGNIAYAMTGKDPIRPEWVDTRFPLPADGSAEWTGKYKTMPFSFNPERGYFGGWNNKASKNYDNNENYDTSVFNYGIFHRGHIIEEFFKQDKKFTFEEIRDLSTIIASTTSFGSGGDTWSFVEEIFSQAVHIYPTDARLEALELMNGYEGFFIEGGPAAIATAALRQDAWVLQHEWILEVLRLTFLDELWTGGSIWDYHDPTILFNVFLHAVRDDSVIKNNYNWFSDSTMMGTTEDVDLLIVTALDNVLSVRGPAPWNVPRGTINYSHQILGQLPATPFSSRSTYAQCVEIGRKGPVRIESFFPLGESGNILLDPGTGAVIFDNNFFSMKPYFDTFTHRPFPLFKKNKHN